MIARIVLVVIGALFCVNSIKCIGVATSPRPTNCSVERATGKAKKLDCIKNFFATMITHDANLQNNTKTCATVMDIEKLFNDSFIKMTPCISPSKVKTDARKESTIFLAHFLSKIDAIKVQAFVRAGGVNCVRRNASSIGACRTAVFRHHTDDHVLNRTRNAIIRTLLNTQEKEALRQQQRIHDCVLRVVETCQEFKNSSSAGTDLIVLINKALNETIQAQAQRMEKGKITKVRSSSSRLGVILGSLAGVAALAALAAALVLRSRRHSPHSPQNPQSLYSPHSRSVSVAYEAKETNEREEEKEKD